jgi:hypothetical protein
LATSISARSDAAIASISALISGRSMSSHRAGIGERPLRT